MTNPGGKHWRAIKMILRYIKGTSGVALCFRGSKLVLKTILIQNLHVIVIN